MVESATHLHHEQAKLGWIDIDGCNDDIRMLVGNVNEVEMTLVEVPHGGDKGNSLA